jgi:hypothetical protein
MDGIVLNHNTEIAACALAPSTSMQVFNCFGQLFAELLDRVHGFGVLLSSIQVEANPLF